MQHLYHLERSTPERQGVKSGAILEFLQAIEQVRTNNMDQDIHSFMLLRHGYVIAEGWWEPYTNDAPHMLFSLSKSFTSTAIGFAVQEGLLTVEDMVVSYFKEECPNPEPKLSRMKIKHLLSMNTGHIVDTTDYFFRREDGNWIKAFLEVPVEKEPGTHFLYNTGATYMLSAILQRITGEKLIDYLQPRLFEPLSISGATWETCPMGYNTGGFGLRVKTEDIAKFGQLYLDKGMLEGKQLLKEEWIQEATAIQSDNSANGPGDWGQGYGYQFWRCRHKAYRGDGAFGQFCIVMPELDAVLAITSGMKDMQKPLDIVWEKLLPGFMESSLLEDQDYQKLQEKLSALKLLLPEGMPDSTLENRSGEKTYCLESNPFHLEEMTFHFQADRILLRIKEAGEIQEYSAGIGYWSKGSFRLDGKQEPAAFTGCWENANTLILKGCLLQAPFANNYRIQFDENNILIEQRINVGFENPQPVSIKGIMKA
jgi:CubicO group peptidase (beta-lactamase class C family)